MLIAGLKEIQKFLEEHNFSCTLLPLSEKLPIDQLVIELVRDSQARERVLLIRAARQDLSQNDALLGITSRPQNYQELQLIVTLPFYVIEAQIPEVARFILLLNKGMELPGFELSEVDRLIFFRHACVVPEDHLDERILLSIIGMIEILVDTFGSQLEAVATGAQSLQQIVEEAQRMILLKNKDVINQ